MPYSEAQLAYVAGFFDGEGCVSVTENSRGHIAVKATFSQNNLAPLVWIRELFGGSIHLQGNKRTHNLVIGDAKAEVLFKSILPYLQVKGPQVEAALKIRATPSYVERSKLRDEVRRLKAV